MLCECGCGKEAGNYSRGAYVGGVWMRGKPRKFFGHHALKVTHCVRGHHKTPENMYPSGQCKLCGRARDKERQAEVVARIVANQKKDPEKHAKAVRDWAKSQTGRISVRATKAKQLYGLSPERYHNMLLDQEGKCKICKIEMTAESHKKNSIAVDHDHMCCSGARTCGKCVRGMLCSMCNFMLGTANDDPEVLAKAIQYLKEAQCQTQQLLRTLYELKEPLAATA
jgi:hypothetical protein